MGEVSVSKAFLLLLLCSDNNVLPEITGSEYIYIYMFFNKSLLSYEGWLLSYSALSHSHIFCSFMCGCDDLFISNWSTEILSSKNWNSLVGKIEPFVLQTESLFVLVGITREALALHSAAKLYSQSCLVFSLFTPHFALFFSLKQAASLLLRLSLGWLIDTDYSWRHRGHNLWRTNIKASVHTPAGTTLNTTHKYLSRHHLCQVNQQLKCTY